MTDKLELGNHRGVKKTLEELEAQRLEEERLREAAEKAEAGKKDKPARTAKPIQLLLDPETHAKFKTLCYLRGVKMTEISAKLIKEWMESETDKTPWLK